MSKYARKLRVERARLLTKDFPHKPQVAKSFAMRRGQLYEEMVVGKLGMSYGPQFASRLWFHYVEVGGRNGAIQLDGVLFDISRGIIYVIEIKHTHTHTAWLQMTNFYHPVLEAAFSATPPGSRCAGSHGAIGGGTGIEGKLSPSPLWTFKFLEVCNVYDGDENAWLQGQVAVNRVYQPEEAHSGAFNVMIMKRGGGR